MNSTLLRLDGRDVLDLLHRVTTNALLDLASGEARGTLFCDFRGRLLHRAVVARWRDTVFLLRDDAGPAPLAAHLDRQIFREDVRVTDLSERLAVWADANADADADAAVVEGRASGVELPEVVRVSGDVALRIGTRDPAPSDGAAPGSARIHAARPAHGHEIVDEFTPYEVNLAHEVHLDKGCYTGQEALQRLVTYDSVRRRLARVAGSGEAPATPADLVQGGKRVGRLTSAMGNVSGGWIGLAVVAWGLGAAADVRVGDSLLERLEPVALRRPIGRAWAAAG